MKKVLFTYLALLLPLSLLGQKSKYSPIIDKTIKQDSAYFIGVFKDIHQNPELGFMEYRTAKIVADHLSKYEVKTSIAKTGVVGILKNGNGPTVMYRADMDANAVEDKINLPYRSTTRGYKTACTPSTVYHSQTISLASTQLLYL